MAPSPLLRLRDLSVRYGATMALGGVDLDVLPGTVHALVGENGAGKSTLLRALVGLAGRVSGRAEMLGAGGLPRSPREAEARGVAFVPQELTLCSQLGVAEQVTLGREPRTQLGFVSRRAQREQAALRLAALGAELDLDASVGALPAPDRKLLQIARALASEPRLLLLDEPSAVLDAQVAARVARMARAWSRRGRSVLLVSHHVEDVLQQADVVTVLRDGAVVSTSSSAELDPPELLRRMVGRELEPGAADTSAIDAARPLLTLPPPLGLTLREGEVLGLFGLVGAGRSDFIEALARHLRGAALVPEDRAAKGLVPTFSLCENVFLPAPFAWLLRKRERREAQAWIERLRIRAAGPDAPIGSLSGGNQQKVLLARALARRPRVLLLDEPTQGVDVAAKAEIHALVRGLAREGTAIVLSSSDLPELLGLAHTISVLRGGQLAGVLPVETATEEALLALACGVAA